MLAEVVQGANLRAVEIAGCRQHRNADVSELAPLGNQCLPVSVVGGMLQPALEPGICGAVQRRQFAIGLAALIPTAVQRIPSTTIAISGVVQRGIVRCVERPRIDEIQEDSTLHRHVDAGCGGCRGGDGLERWCATLECCPLGKTAVAAAIHADLAVAPWLGSGPGNHRCGIAAVVLIRTDRIRAAALAATVGNHAGIAVCSHRLGIGPGPVVVCIDGEGQQHR